MDSILKVIKKVISYVISLGIVILLLKYAYREVSIKELVTQLHQVRLHWIGACMLLGLASHLVRAYRWNLLLQPLGIKVDLFKSFLALMIGYVSNLFVPRLGEIVRCKVLSRATGIPTGTLLGTVGMERLIDLAGFLVVFALTLLVSSTEIKYVLEEIRFFSQVNLKFSIYVVVGIVILLALIILVVYCTSTSQNKLLARSKSFMASVKEGFYIILHSRAKKLIAYTTIIKWGLYYLSDYVGLFAIVENSWRDWKVGLIVLTMSSLSFAVPVQGAMGAYHILVSSVLIGYGFSQKDALLYATVVYGAHFLVIVLGAGIGIILEKFRNS